MKLPNPAAWRLAAGRGNFNEPPAPGELPEETFSDGGSTPPASTTHSHVQWEINRTRMRASFPALVRVRLSLASIAITGDVGFFCKLNSQYRQSTKTSRIHGIDVTYIPISEFAWETGEAMSYKGKRPGKGPW